MFTNLLKRKISSNFIFDGMMLMFINFSLLFSFGIIFGFCLFVEIIFSRLNIKMLFPPSVFIVLFGLISIYIWFIFGKEINRALKTKKTIKFLVINLIGSSPILLILIYENLLIGIREMRGSSGCVNGLVAFSSIALGSMIFQFIFLLGGVLWANEN
ncbi:MAG: hypothetical protein ABIC82_04040 [bacterium]